MGCRTAVVVEHGTGYGGNLLDWSMDRAAVFFFFLRVLRHIYALAFCAGVCAPSSAHPTACRAVPYRVHSRLTLAIPWQTNPCVRQLANRQLRHGFGQDIQKKATRDARSGSGWQQSVGRAARCVCCLPALQGARDDSKEIFVVHVARMAQRSGFRRPAPTFRFTVADFREGLHCRLM